MSNKTRKHIWPGAVMASLAVVGVLAALLVLAWNPGVTDAHGGGTAADHCSDISNIAHDVAAEIAGTMNADGSGQHSCDNAGADTTGPGPGPGPDDMMTDIAVVSSSSSGSATVELKLTLEVPSGGVPVGGAFVLYLEDDFQEPDSISASDVYFVSMPPRVTTGNGSRVYATVSPEIETDSHFTADKKDIDIRVSVPDMCTNATGVCEGSNGLVAGDTVTMVIQKSAGIKNPSEAGSHSTGYAILGPTDNVPSGPSGDGFMKSNELATVAKISLSDVDNSRGYEMTVTGSGFNNGTTASVYVLAIPGSKWDALDCYEMVMAVPADAAGNTGMANMANPYCAMYADLPAAQMAVVGDLDYTKGAAEAALCRAIVRSGTEVGSALVGSDDKVAVTFEVTVPTFKPGNVNYICMADGEGRMSNTDVEDFNLEPSIAVVPSTASTGDTVNVFAQDYQNTGQGFSLLKIGGQTTAPNGMSLNSFITDREPISISGTGSITFEVPGGFEGVLRVDAIWGDANSNGKCDTGETTCVSEDSKITLGGAELNSSKTDVLPNETLTINGNGFGTQTCIAPSSITLDNVPVMVHDDSVGDNGCVEVSNSGQFVATVILWPADRNAITNPTLIPGTHMLEVADDEEYSAEISLTIAQPSISVTPDIAGPRDYITITGENWAVDNLDNSLSDPISVVVEDYQNGRTYPLYADSVGRFSVEHRVHRRVAIPDTVQVKANYDSGRVVQIGSFAVPASTITVTPGEGQPGDMVTLTASNMPVYTEADYVEIGGTTYSDPGVNTDRDGNITVEDVLIPGLDPGIYSVVINVDGTIAIGEVNVLAESSARGAPAMLPGATESLGDSLVAIFHFDDVGKVWSFYDPRPEFADLNTLTEMVNGEAYWILVSETVDDVVLNNKVRSLTCRGADCWNLEVW